MNRSLSLRAGLAAIALAAAPLAAAQVTLTPYASGFTAPVEITHAGDGSGRVFVVEQAGRIQIVRNGVRANTAFLDISSIVRSGGEQGLLGLAFPRDFALSGHFFVYHNVPPSGGTGGSDITIARYRAAGDTADPASRLEILRIPHPTHTNHNGGKIAFGPDGHLYIGVGDGGGGGDPFGAAQNLNDLRGKILRIDVESAVPYAIPANNPFRNQAGRRGEIWAYGLRNPWRFSFDRETGDMLIGDVGQEQREEVDFIRAGSAGGQNFGWSVFEGTRCYNPPANCSLAGHVPPMIEYAHDSLGGQSISGGYVSRGYDFPEARGRYLFGDYGSGRIWMTTSATLPSAGFTQVGSLAGISTFGEDEEGNVYAASLGGQTYRIGPLDADGDGMSDGYETLYFGNVTAGNAGADTDNDGLANLNEYREGLNPFVKDNDIFSFSPLFARQQYRDLLAREGDYYGVRHWTYQLDNAGSSRAGMIQQFLASAEQQAVIAPVVRLYFAYFLRVPDYAGLSFWIAQHRGGNATLPQISQSFAQSGEFQARYGSLSNSQFVSQVYQNVLGRSPDPAGAAYWTGRLDQGQITRGQLMLAFSESAEYQPIIGSEVTVTLIYVGMLRRAPDTPGFNFWVGQLDAGGSPLPLIQGFLSSTEYRQRFMP